MPPLSVEEVCDLLTRSRLLAAEELRALRHRWHREAGAPKGDADAFLGWLTAGEYVTTYQADQLLRGRTDRFFLNDYKLLDRVGSGRMAGVYKAVHSLGLVVAIKILPPSRAKDPLILARFRREARLAVRLKHANVVRTFEIDEDRGLHYLVMEYLDGETLDDVLRRRGKLPPAEAVRLIHQALLGLQHLHEQDVVHRDLKPGNLMLLPRPVAGQPDTTERARVKILDVGLGRTLFDEGGAGADGVELTAAGDVIGTPAYMAPEQARDARGADVRSDIYSLGCTLYHALTGTQLFPDRNVLRQMMRHATDVPRPVRDFCPEAPAGLQEILNEMMAKDPVQRFPTPERAAKALAAFLAGAPEPAPPPEPEPQMHEYLRRVEAADARNTDEPVAPSAPPTVAEMVTTVGAPGKPSRRRWLLFAAAGVGVGLVVSLGVHVGRILRRRGDAGPTAPAEPDGASAKQ
jgi:serine/threonine protein kinase